jgi:hypothetical protein
LIAKTVGLPQGPNLKMKTALLGLFAAALLVCPVFGAQMICKDTGKEVKLSCCCTVKDGKFVCKFSNKPHDTCCCETK